VHCPVCGVRAAVRSEPPWLAVSCGNCGTYRITVPAAEVVGLYSAALRRRVSSRVRTAALDRGQNLAVDLNLLDVLAGDEPFVSPRSEA
jgi:hypothetical protein